MKSRRLAAGRIAAFLSAVSILGAQPAHSRMNREPELDRPDVIMAEWEGGRCSVRGPILTYVSGDDEGPAPSSTPLDISLRHPERLLCSREFTVEMDGPAAVAAIGADKVLAGVEYLGRLGDSLILANSYSVDLSEVAAEGITGARLEGRVLAIETGAGRVWKLDLANPVEWRIY